MSYSLIDKSLYDWAKGYSIVVQTQYQDTEVRSIEIVDGQSRKYQIWIEDLGNGEFTVNVWDYTKRKNTFSCSFNNIVDKLEEAYHTIQHWTII